MDHYKYSRVVPGSIDSHCHLPVMTERELPTEEILTHCFQNGLSACIDISITLDNLEERLSWSERFPGVYLTAGYHPAATAAVEPEAATDALRSTLHQHRIVAIGEIGVDKHREHAGLQEQRALFEAQLQLAREVGLPVVIHNRDAEEELYALLRKRPPVRESVMHCYSGTPEYARKFVDLGFVVSFAGNVTFKKGADAIREAARSVPTEALLLETDAPFLAPEPARGRPNHPGYLGHIYAFVAELRNEPLSALTETVAQNCHRVFGISP